MRKYKAKENVLGLCKAICDDCKLCTTAEREFRIVVRKAESSDAQLYGLECAKHKPEEVRVF